MISLKTIITYLKLAKPILYVLILIFIVVLILRINYNNSKMEGLEQNNTSILLNLKEERERNEENLRLIEEKNKKANNISKDLVISIEEVKKNEKKVIEEIKEIENKNEDVKDYLNTNIPINIHELLKTTRSRTRNSNKDTGNNTT